MSEKKSLQERIISQKEKNLDLEKKIKNLSYLHNQDEKKKIEEVNLHDNSESKEDIKVNLYHDIEVGKLNDFTTNDLNNELNDSTSKIKKKLPVVKKSDVAKIGIYNNYLLLN